ncbi:translesion DNA synthesis-associated protein ImuA (plasmid) [Burkholderia vietnamiensis]|uniref:Recombinase RecA n=1 Tax=Burkholderia vietnamiensis (strain G4 / LMG 22486) TaxID=269482 RepID=A4JU22_BURVG|nr:conserved hypothetical protein [Burkholderia vietnamiensis G4]MCB4350067.1 translesion DNA synthesis-associated protein ImuA [Burkholderia vietnamiensis]
MSAIPKNVEDIHPALWRGSQLGRAAGAVVDTGYAALSEQLPGGGWPVSTLVELLVAQTGIGEIRLLRPALIEVGKRPIALVKPPQTPNALGLAYLGIPLEQMLCVQPTSTADTLWSAEQILRTGSCGAVLLWQQHIKQESLRRLLAAAQTSTSIFFVVRPLASAQDASPAPLRLTLRPATDGVEVEVIKRRGPAMDSPINVQISPSPVLVSPRARPRTSPSPSLEPSIAIQQTPVSA